MKFTRLVLPLMLALGLMLAIGAGALPNEPMQNDPALNATNTATDAVVLNNPTDILPGGTTDNDLPDNNGGTTDGGLNSTTDLTGNATDQTYIAMENEAGIADTSDTAIGAPTTGNDTTANTTITADTTLSNTTNVADIDAEDNNYIIGIVAIVIAAIIVIVLIIYAVSRKNHTDTRGSTKR